MALLAAAIMGLMTVSHGVRPQFAERMQDAVFAINMISSLITGLLATIATFATLCRTGPADGFFCPPRRSSVWLSTIG